MRFGKVVSENLNLTVTMQPGDESGKNATFGFFQTNQSH